VQMQQELTEMLKPMESKKEVFLRKDCRELRVMFVCQAEAKDEMTCTRFLAANGSNDCCFAGTKYGLKICRWEKE